MTGFTFDAKAALKAAQQYRTYPNRPNRPSHRAFDGTGLGELGGLGSARLSDTEVTTVQIIRSIDQKRATVHEACGKKDWPEDLDPDTGAYLYRLRLVGPSTYGAMAQALGWGGTRAWRAEAKLRAAGLVHYDNGKAVVKEARNTDG